MERWAKKMVENAYLETFCRESRDRCPAVKMDEDDEEKSCNEGVMARTPTVRRPRKMVEVGGRKP